MSFVDPGDFSALQVVDETDMDNIRNDLLYLNERINPVGVILDYGGDTAPDGWLICDGSAVSRVTYAALFAVFGSKFGAGNGSTTFNLPDFRLRVAIGKAASGTGSVLGSTGGTKDAINVSHNHTQNSHNHTQNAHNHGNTGIESNSHWHSFTVQDHNHAVDGDTGNRVAVSHAGAVNGLHPSGPEKATFSDIDPHGDFESSTGNDVGDHTHAVGNATATNQSTTATNNSSGSSGTDQNLPPYVVVHKIVKY